MEDFREESDSMGSIKVPANKYWGAQTQRSIENFPVGNEIFPPVFIKALALVKLASAEVNKDLNRIGTGIAEAIIKAAQEVVDGKFNNQFPLVVWQTGSGTQTNMNANEVISNRAIEILGGKIGSKSPVHPNDHVNKSQSSNDVIPGAMHISTVFLITEHLLPSLKYLEDKLYEKSQEFADVVKIGRTHLQDATPITLGQEFSGYYTQIKKGIVRIEKTLDFLYELALGGTAVGTGLNSHPEFAERIAKRIAERTGLLFRTGENKFEGLAAHDAIVYVSGAIRTVAISLMKIANDIRWLSSGPRAGFGELIIPVNEPGSSIMPSKTNPTQAESVLQVVSQIIGNDTTIAFANAIGSNFELNVMKPVMIFNLLQSIQLLGDVAKNFTIKCVIGIKVNHERIKELLGKSLMLVTALTPRLGYDKAAWVAKKAYEEKKSLKQVLLENNLIPENEIDSALDPSKMTKPS
ncbi:MAG: Fumarate hydratase class II [Candidatus Heimdallarchaeota archaeon LC_3]|nr:MAG: Fumarate hydratase class II [Candidatus Heimdallarchaeota archaeon LC_3]